MDAATNVESLSFTFDGLSRTQYAITVHRADHEAGVSRAGTRHQPAAPAAARAPRGHAATSPIPDVSGRTVRELLLLGLGRTSQTSADAVTGHGKLDVLRYGHVLKARQLVGVRGAGIAYDGAYYVTSVTHDIKRGEYQQSFSLARDGLVSLTPLVMA